MVRESGAVAVDVRVLWRERRGEGGGGRGEEEAGGGGGGGGKETNTLSGA